MFENLVSQKTGKLLIKDIKNGILPPAILFSGEEYSGKLTAALELARIQSCTGENKASWGCDCPSCMRHKALTCTNMILMGPRDCALEISAAKDTFIKAYRDNTPYLTAARYLFLRSIRKLTLRFNGILLQGDKDLSKIGAIIQDINDDLELLDFPRPLIPFDEAVKLCESLEIKARDLERDFLYDSIPINQIRNMEEWAYVKSEEGKKTIIIENAERMLPGVRNALLKILEEPPADCQFILITSKKNAVMQTILSRVRNYNFSSRTLEQQQNVIKGIYRNEYFNGKIGEYLETFLPVPAAKLKEEAQNYYSQIVRGSIPQTSEIVKNCGKFEPRLSLKIFLNHISTMQKPLLKSQNGCEAALESLQKIKTAWENVTMYNQSVNSALEILVRDLSKINITYGRILCEAM